MKKIEIHIGNNDVDFPKIELPIIIDISKKNTAIKKDEFLFLKAMKKGKIQLGVNSILENEEYKIYCRGSFGKEKKFKEIKIEDLLIELDLHREIKSFSDFNGLKNGFGLIINHYKDTQRVYQNVIIVTDLDGAEDEEPILYCEFRDKEDIRFNEESAIIKDLLKKLKKLGFSFDCEIF